MQKFTMRYPGDPPCLVEKVSRAEFFSLFPPDDRNVVMTSFGQDGTKTTEIVEHLGTKIVCDLCAEDPGDVIWLIRRSKAYCDSCFDHCRPHTQDLTEETK